MRLREGAAVHGQARLLPEVLVVQLPDYPHPQRLHSP